MTHITPFYNQSCPEKPTMICLASFSTLSNLLFNLIVSDATKAAQSISTAGAAFREQRTTLKTQWERRTLLFYEELVY
jgi:hypothetical protein